MKKIYVSVEYSTVLQMVRFHWTRVYIAAIDFNYLFAFYMWWNLLETPKYEI